MENYFIDAENYFIDAENYFIDAENYFIDMGKNSKKFRYLNVIKDNLFF